MTEELEAAFRALADGNRRRLLDRLRERDGQALAELEAELPGMTRFGVMKHLRVLEDAHLLTTRRDGRRKLHFLNPVPIQLIADRWISRYAAPWVTGLADLKQTLEADSPMSAPKQVYEIFIRTTPERLWQALTDGELSRQYYFNTEVRSDLEVGKPFQYFGDDGVMHLDGEILEIDPPRRLVTTFSALWSAGHGGRPAVPHHVRDRAHGRDLQADDDPRRVRVGDRDLPRGGGWLELHPLRPEDAAGDRRAAQDR